MKKSMIPKAVSFVTVLMNESTPEDRTGSSAVPYGCFLPDLTRFGTCRPVLPDRGAFRQYTVEARRGGDGDPPLPGR